MNKEQNELQAEEFRKRLLWRKKQNNDPRMDDAPNISSAQAEIPEGWKTKEGE